MVTEQAPETRESPYLSRDSALPSQGTRRSGRAAHPDTTKDRHTIGAEARSTTCKTQVQYSDSEFASTRSVHPLEAPCRPPRDASRRRRGRRRPPPPRESRNSAFFVLHPNTGMGAKLPPRCAHSAERAAHHQASSHRAGTQGLVGAKAT